MWELNDGVSIEYKKIIFTKLSLMTAFLGVLPLGNGWINVLSSKSLEI